MLAGCRRRHATAEGGGVSDYIPRAELAKALGVTVKTLRRLHESGALCWIPVTPGGRKVVYRRGDVDRYLDAQRGAA